jgi:hypothetical protein
MMGSARPGVVRNAKHETVNHSAKEYARGKGR